MNYTGAAIMGTAGVQLLVVAAEGYNAIERVTQPDPIKVEWVVPDFVVPGTEAVIKYNILKTTTCPGSAGRVWQGNNGFYTTEMVRPSGIPANPNWTWYAVPTLIPNLAPEGAIKLTIKGEYRCEGEEPIPFSIGPVEMVVKTTAP